MKRTLAIGLTAALLLIGAAVDTLPGGILPTTLFATICSTTVAIVSAKLLQRYWPAPRVPAGRAV